MCDRLERIGAVYDAQKEGNSIEGIQNGWPKSQVIVAVVFVQKCWTRFGGVAVLANFWWGCWLRQS